MFCGNCGNDVGDSKFCGQCGAPVENNAPKASVKLPSLNLNKKNMGIFAGIAAGIVAVIVALILIFGGSKPGASSPEKVAKNFVDALEINPSPKKIVNVVPDFMVDMMCEEYGINKPSRKALIKKLERQLAMYGDAGRDGKVLGARVVDEEYLLEEYMDDLSDYGASYTDKLNIKDACMVEVGIQDNYYDEERTYIVFCIKMGNRWYAIDID